MPDNARLTTMIDIFKAMEASEHPGLSALRDPLACDQGFFMDVFEWRVAREIDPSPGDVDDPIEMFAYRGGSLAGIAVALFGDYQELTASPCGVSVSRAAELLGIEETEAEHLFLASLPEGWEYNYERMMLGGEVSYQAVAELPDLPRHRWVEWTVFKPAYRINKYLFRRAYVGPEEGGWYYDTGRFIEEVGRADSLAEAHELRETHREQVAISNIMRQDVSSQGHYGFIIEEEEGAHFPTVPPVYS